MLVSVGVNVNRTHLIIGSTQTVCILVSGLEWSFWLMACLELGSMPLAGNGVFLAVMDKSVVGLVEGNWKDGFSWCL